MSFELPFSRNKKFIYKIEDKQRIAVSLVLPNLHVLLVLRKLLSGKWTEIILGSRFRTYCSLCFQLQFQFEFCSFLFWVLDLLIAYFSLSLVIFCKWFV